VASDSLEIAFGVYMDANFVKSNSTLSQAFQIRPPLVLVNGLAEQAETWYRNLAAWRDHFDVYVPHLAAYESGPLHQRIEADLPVTIEYLVEQLRHYLDSFVSRPPYYFAANSMGGKIMVEFANCFPEQVAKLVLICPSGLSDVERLPIVEGVRGRKMREVIESVFHDPSQADVELISMYQRQVRAKRWRTGMMHTIRGTMGHSVRDRISELKCPTLLIVGDQDRIVDPQDSISAATRIPNGQLIVIENCGHAPQLERPDYVNPLVIDFLKESSAEESDFLRPRQPR
jgi:pimeloyl-ACP methyl ester carboxylesterase